MQKHASFRPVLMLPINHKNRPKGVHLENYWSIRKWHKLSSDHKALPKSSAKTILNA